MRFLTITHHLTPKMPRQLRSASKASKPTTPKPTPKPLPPPAIPASPASAAAAAAAPASSPPSTLFPSLSSFESFLAANHASHPGLWLRLAKKHSHLACITYDQALDAALCHGWIDGQKKPLDAQCFLQRFTPRRKASLWSKRNVAKAEALAAAGRMREGGVKEMEAARADGRWERAYSSSSNAEVPRDFQDALDGQGHAAVFFKTITRSQRYSFLFRLETAKKPETRQRRIEQFVKLLADEKFL